MTRQEYADRVERRRARLEHQAVTLGTKAARRFTVADNIAERFAGGQPIILNHHSTKGAFRDRDRMGRNIHQGVALQKDALRATERADAVGSGGISSDDPDAIDKLRENVAKLTELNDKLKATNKLVRKNDRAGLAGLGYAESTVDKLLTPVFGRVGIPSFEITNRTANIRRIQQRIEQLEKLAVKAAMEPITGVDETAGHWSITENIDENRVLITVENRTSKELFMKIRSAGFVFNRSLNAFSRKRSNGAIYAAKYALMN